MGKQRDIKSWVILILCVVSICATLISTWAIRGNDMKHLDEKMDNLLVRVERIENLFLSKGEQK